MKHKYFKVVCSLICLMLIMTSNSFALSNDEDVSTEQNQYTITESYEYPVVPGTDEWKSFTSHVQMIQACQVPENILKKMTTEALFQTVMDFPLLGDALLFDDSDAGYNALKTNCNALRELLEREDASTLFNNYNSQRYLTFASDIGIYEGYTKYIAEQCFDLIYSKINNATITLRATPSKVTNANVKTPKGKKVPHYENLTNSDHGDTSSTVASYEAYLKNTYPSAVKISGPKPAYNCHSYAWHSTSTTNNNWIDGADSKLYWEDGSYKKTTSPKNADKVVYKNGTTITHSAIYFNAPTNVVYSKWNRYGVYKHSRSYYPYIGKDNTYTSYTKS